MSWINAPINFGTEVLKDADKLTKRVAGEVLQKVVVASPVDTGQYRNSHRVSIDSDDFSVEIVGSDISGSGTISRGVALINSRGGLGHVIKIQNNQKYSLRIENGWSGQAPNGVYSLAFQSISTMYR